MERASTMSDRALEVGGERRARRLAVGAAIAIVATLAAPARPSPLPGVGAERTSVALAGSEAATYRLPGDVVPIRSWTDADGNTATRYQQTVEGAAVYGGQLTVTRDAAGSVVAVIGAHFPGLQVAPGAVPTVDARGARRRVESELGADGDWTTTLRLDPGTGRLYWEVESRRPDSRPVRWIDAATGATTRSYDGIATGEGVGVKGEPRQVDSRPAAGGGFELIAPDERRLTFAARRGANRVADRWAALMVDADDRWNLQRVYSFEGDQRSGVDAHYYAGVVDDFFLETFGRDGFDDAGAPIVSVVHYGSNFCNAFWNGATLTYGDGYADGTCLPLSGALDVVAHEFSHGVTEHTSDLVYLEEPGALNEAFSDLMGAAVEFWASAAGRDPGRTADWLMTEEVLTSRFVPIRNLADPAVIGDPSHYTRRLVGAADNGFVHRNSGIANHAFYLAVEGGGNAGCAAAYYRDATHVEDCDVVVAGIGLERATEIFYRGFTSLPEDAGFCAARHATVAVAGADAAAISDAWEAVGLGPGCTSAPCTGDAAASVPFESPHPYGNRGNCAWTYDNGSAGFAFHFSLLSTEDGWDYVYVEDGDGNVLAAYTGNYRREVTSPCIGTTTGSVRLVSDRFVTAPGFVVDAVVACRP